MILKCVLCDLPAAPGRDQCARHAMEHLDQVTGKFFIFHDCGPVRNFVLWWKPESNGYTTNLMDAGLYSEADARGIERGRKEDVAIPAHEVLAHAETTVSIEYGLWIRDAVRRRKSTKPGEEGTEKAPDAAG